MKKAKKRINRRGDSFLRDALILCAITLVAGGLLALVYNVTLNPIQDAAERAETSSYKKVIAAEEFKEDDALTKKFEDFKPEGSEFEKMKVAYDKSGQKTGYVFLVTAKEGYGGNIQFSMGISSDGTIQGIEVLTMSETAGLGAKCTEDAFKNQFKGKKGEELALVKGKSKGDSEISAISGATITSKAITKTVNQVLKFMKTIEG